MTFSIWIIDLCPASNARLDKMTEMIERNCFLVTFCAPHPFCARTDQAHLAAKHIEELRQLVEPSFAQPAPETRHAWIVLLSVNVARFFRRIHQHRAEFISDERLVRAPDPLLPEYDRPPAAMYRVRGTFSFSLHPNQQRDDREQWCENDQKRH